MKSTVIAQDRLHLDQLIDREIIRGKDGFFCDLNHLDISRVHNLGNLFLYSDFNGDISQWDTSHVTDMSSMFRGSQFNGDISSWNTSNVENMSWMFANSKFNGNISNWNVSKVKDMSHIFEESCFVQDISHWKPFCMKINHDKLTGNKKFIFEDKELIPFWDLYENQYARNNAIEAYHLKLKMEGDLNHKNKVTKIKI